jgi:hypothetical protein
MQIVLQLFLLLAISPIIRRADRGDAEYRALGAKYPALVSMSRMGDGTLIGSRWVLTAAHVARGASRTGAKVHAAGRDYEIQEAFIHPQWTEMSSHDIGLLYLKEPVRGIAPVALNRSIDEKGAIAILLGHGKSGPGVERGSVEDGIARGATSKVDSVDAAWLYFSFDKPPAGTRLEGAPGAGDSGGPALIERNGKTYIAGVSSAGYDGENGPGTYGAIDVFTRVSTHLGWIDSVMTAQSKRAQAR